MIKAKGVYYGKNISLKDWFLKHRVSSMVMGSNWAFNKLIEKLAKDEQNK